MGYPGRLEVEAAYTLTATALRLDLAAATDKPTIVNLTAHPLWNLAGEGEGTTDDHLVTLRVRRYTPIDNAILRPAKSPRWPGQPSISPLQLPSAPGSTSTSTSSASPEVTITFVVERDAGRSMIPVGWSRNSVAADGSRSRRRSPESSFTALTSRRQPRRDERAPLPFDAGAWLCRTSNFPIHSITQSFPTTVFAPVVPSDRRPSTASPSIGAKPRPD